MSKYELMMILNPQLDKAGLDTLQKEIKVDLDEAGMKIAAEDIW